ncbi:MAG: HipA N-terminal domain-containing protein [Euzebyaceae bacterium]|jgi:hypothetical protein|nr:HipA N-terminal domain-containing protein [Euzebyaceae bacterium]
MVVWQDRETRLFHHVGTLEADPAGDYRFQYQPEARLAPNFRPFMAFPDSDRQYRSTALFPFFSNRVMSPSRPDFGAYLDALGLTRDQADPVELLARSGGARATDTVQIVAEPITENGVETARFLVSGCRYIDGADERIARLVAGQPLRVRPEPENPQDSRALLLDVTSGDPVGWVPRYLLDYLHKHIDQGADVQVYAERVNGPEASWHMRVLARLEVRPANG